jgi:hypothetical protein
MLWKENGRGHFVEVQTSESALLDDSKCWTLSEER